MSYFRQISHEADAPSSQTDRQLYSTRPPAWQSGVAGVERPVTPATDSGVLAMVLAVIVLIGLNMRHVKRIFRSLPQDLLSVRRRSNAFDEHTANETRVAMLQLLQLWVYEGLLLFMWLQTPGKSILVSGGLTSQVAILVGLACALYLFQLGACITVGYVFTDQQSASLWQRGLNASQIILGWALSVPALVSLFYPGLAQDMIIIAALLYIASRICYIYKGFRIFYHKFSSLLYFILYLCTLEIIPVIITCLLAVEICVKS